MLYPPPVNYERPESLREALSLINNSSKAILISGGTIGILALKKRTIRPDLVVDIGKLSELKGIEFAGGMYKIGSSVKIYEILESGFTSPGFSLLKQAASKIGDPLIRNMGTVGGNVCLGDPSNDLPPALLVLDAEINAVSQAGERNLKISDFYKGPFTTALAKNEMVHHISFAEPGKGYRYFYYKYYIRHLDHSVFNIAALGRVIDGKIDDLRMAVGGLSVRIPSLLETSWIKGKAAGKEEMERMINLALEKCICVSNRQGSAELKRSVIEKVTQMALKSVAGDKI